MFLLNMYIRMYVSTCMCVCMLMYGQIHMCVCMYACIYTHTHPCICTYVRTLGGFADALAFLFFGSSLSFSSLTLSFLTAFSSFLSFFSFFSFFSFLGFSSSSSLSLFPSLSPLPSLLSAPDFPPIIMKHHQISLFSFHLLNE
jgi:hypothetical protein